MSKAPAKHSLAFLMLAHEEPEVCARLARHILKDGHRLVIHLDLKAETDFHERFRNALGALSEQVEWCRRWSVGWGEWSMIEATLSGLNTIASNGPKPDHVYLLSGADYPLRPLKELQAFLAKHPGTDFIEHRDIRDGRWVKRGPQEARYQSYHFFNWRSTPRLFSWSLRLQKALGIQRRMPENFQPHFGSQWWVLSWAGCETVLKQAADPRVLRFFRRCWVPDELFFQTVIASKRQPARRDNRHLTYFQFTPYGVPLVLHDEHRDFLSLQPFYFARKLHPGAHKLRDALDEGVLTDKTPALNDLEVGYVNEAYDEFLHRHRHGIRGARSWGHPGPPILGQLSRNDRDYFVILADDPELLGDAQQQLTNDQKLLCHGQLFADTKLEFAGGASSCSGYGSDEVQIRDQDRANFLAEILRDAPRGLPGFCCSVRSKNIVPVPAENRDGQDHAPAQPSVDRHDAPLLTMLTRDPRCHVVHLAKPGDDRQLFAQLEQWHEYEPGKNHDDAPAKRIRARWTRLDPASLNPESLAAVLKGQPLAAESTLVTRRSPRRLFLHIGVHRTGTTAIQRLLHNNRERLAAQDVHYGFTTENHTWLASGLQNEDAEADKIVDMIIEDALSAGKGTTIISGEDLCRIAYVDRLAPLKTHFEVRVIVYLRRQDSWLESWYNQNIRWPWELETSRFTPDRFLERHAQFHWLDYGAMLRRWIEVFGEENIDVRVFEEARESANFTDGFCQLCAIDPGDLEQPKRAQNASVSPAAGELLRHLHLFRRAPVDRMVLIRLTAEVFVTLGLDQERHVYSGRDRQRLLQAFGSSNRWVAKTLLGRDDGKLFPGEMPADDCTTPDISIPGPRVLLDQVARSLTGAMLQLIVSTPVRHELSEATMDELLHLEHRRRALRDQLIELNYLLKPRKPVSANFRRGRDEQARDPNLHMANAAEPGATLSPSDWTRATRDLADALSWQDRDDAESHILQRTLSRWQQLTQAPDKPLLECWPDAESLLEGMLEPLLDLLLTELSMHRKLSRWAPKSIPLKLRRQARRIQRLQRKADRLEETLNSTPRRLLRLALRKKKVVAAPR